MLSFLKGIPALIMAGLAIIALFFRGQAANAKKDLAERNQKAAELQKEGMAKASRAAEKGSQNALEQEKKDVKDAQSGRNTFNDF